MNINPDHFADRVPIDENLLKNVTNNSISTITSNIGEKLDNLINHIDVKFHDINLKIESLSKRMDDITSMTESLVTKANADSFRNMNMAIRSGKPVPFFKTFNY